MAEWIDITNLTVRVDDFHVLDQVSLRLPRNQSSIIVGPSGSGKSTLLKAAAGIIPISGGDIRYGEISVPRMSERDNLQFQRDSGFVFQDSALWENRTVYQNVALPLEYHYGDLSPDQIRRRVHDLLRRVQLVEIAERRPAYIAMGDRKLVSFCRALITDPDVVFLDEPSMSVDRARLSLLFDMIRELKSRGRTLVTVTHDPKLTSWLADYLVVLKDGRLVEQGAFSEVRDSRNAVTQEVLEDVMSEAASYDDDLLDLLSGETAWGGAEDIVDTDSDGGLE